MVLDAGGNFCNGHQLATMPVENQLVTLTIHENPGYCCRYVRSRQQTAIRCFPFPVGKILLARVRMLI